MRRASGSTAGTGGAAVGRVSGGPFFGGCAKPEYENNRPTDSAVRIALFFNTRIPGCIMLRQILSAGLIRTTEREVNRFPENAAERSTGAAYSPDRFQARTIYHLRVHPNESDPVPLSTRESCDPSGSRLPTPSLVRPRHCRSAPAIAGPPSPPVGVSLRLVSEPSAARLNWITEFAVVWLVAM